MEVGKTGTAMFELDPKGRPQVFYYGNIREPSSFEARTHVSTVLLRGGGTLLTSPECP